MQNIFKIQLTRLGHFAMAPIEEMGRFGLFFFRAATHIFAWPLQWAKFIEQVYFIGMKSVFVICLTGAFTGMVLGLQGYYTLVKFGSEGLLGAAVALTLVREMGPVLTAIMVIGRAGSAIAAEIGIMRISEQVDALETMDIHPVRFLVSPRLAAALFSFPLLTALFEVYAAKQPPDAIEPAINDRPGLVTVHCWSKVRFLVELGLFCFKTVNFGVFY